MKNSAKILKKGTAEGHNIWAVTVIFWVKKRLEKIPSRSKKCCYYYYEDLNQFPNEKTTANFLKFHEFHIGKSRILYFPDIFRAVIFLTFWPKYYSKITALQQKKFFARNLFISIHVFKVDSPGNMGILDEKLYYNYQRFDSANDNICYEVGRRGLKINSTNWNFHYDIAN